jgi:S-(hydroxymethyl)mycothiol dehydrogenase
MLVDLYHQGRLDLDAFVTEEIGIADVEAAFEKLHHAPAGQTVLRSVVVL